MSGKNVKICEGAFSKEAVFGDTELRQSRDSINNIWGERTPYKGSWPTRVDERIVEEPERWVQSACVLCSNGCGMDIGVKGEGKEARIVGVRGRASDRVNHGRLGPKGMHAWTTNNHKDRLKYPMIRKNGKLERATWDEAMDLIVSKSKDIRERMTSHGIGFYTSGQLFLEEYYALAVIGKGGLSTLHMDGNTRLCTATAAAAMRESFGSDAQPGSYTDVDTTDCLFIVGHNVSATQTVLWTRMLDRLAGPKPPKLIVIDPRKSNTAKEATVHLAPKIGTNMAVLNGLQHLMFKNGYVNEQWCQEHVVGLEELREKVKKYTPELVEEYSGVPQNLLIEAAEILGQTKSLLSTCLQGVYQSNQATASACQVNNINLIRGLIGKPGCGIFQMNGQPTAQNNRETGCDGEFPGFRNNGNTAQMQEIADIWNIDLMKVPAWSQPTHIQSMLNYIEQGTIEMFWVSGTNPLVSLPNLPRVRSLLSQPSLFLICQDIFMTETAMIADVILPAAQWGEKTGCFTNVDRTVHLSHKAVEPPGEAKSDLEIFLDYGKRMDFRTKDDTPLMPWTNSEQVFEEWKKMSKGRPCDYSGMSYDLLTGGSGIQWPCNEKYPRGKERLFDDGHFFTDIKVCQTYGHDMETGATLSEKDYTHMNPAGRAILKSADYIPSLDATNEEYPLQLSTGRRVYHFHTRTKTGRAKALREKAPTNCIELNAKDAEKLGIADGDQCVVKSRRGEIQVPALISKIAEGQTFIPFHFGYFDKEKGSAATAANELTFEQWDPISKQPMFKGGAVSVTKAPGSADTVTIHEKQSAAIEHVEKEKPNAMDDLEHEPVERHLSYWLGATYEALEVLVEILTRVLPNLITDKEMHAGIVVLNGITHQMIIKLKPAVDRYGEEKSYGRNISESIRDVLFPPRRHRMGSYETLATIMALKMYYNHIDGHLRALSPAAAALWDRDFVDRVAYCQKQIERMEAWTNEHLAVKAPQALIVPDKGFGGSTLFQKSDDKTKSAEKSSQQNGHLSVNGEEQDQQRVADDGSMGTHHSKKNRKHSFVEEMAPLPEDVNAGEAHKTMTRGMSKEDVGPKEKNEAHGLIGR